MSERMVMSMGCAAEFAAVLQIQSAMLGKGRLPRWGSVALAAALWLATQILWGDYAPYSFQAVSFNTLRYFAASLFFGGALIQKLFSVVVCGIVILGYGNIQETLMASVHYDCFSADGGIWVLLLTYVVLLNALVWFGIRVIRNRVWSLEPRQKLVSGIYLILAAVMNVIMSIFGKNSDQYNLLLLVCVGLMVSTMAYVVLLTMFGAQALQNSKTQAQMKLEQARADALMESYRTQRRLTHEFSNHMDAMAFYLDQKDLEGARAYLTGISREVAAGTSVVNTHNPLMDALLSKEYHKALQCGVTLNFDLCDLRRFPLEATDLVTVMCNLLDNAIEAAESADPSDVFLRIRKTEEDFVVSVRNRTDRDLHLEEKELPRSTKQEPGHGIGLGNVCGVLDRCKAEYTMSCRDRWFCFTFTLPICGI